MGETHRRGAEYVEILHFKLSLRVLSVSAVNYPFRELGPISRFARAGVRQHKKTLDHRLRGDDEAGG
jgi:hypothetical protein